MSPHRLGLAGVGSRSRTQAGSTVSLTSDTALAFGRSMLHRFDVDWDKHGFEEADLDELAELGLRTLHSVLIDPGQPPPVRHRATPIRSQVAGSRDHLSRLAQTIDALCPPEPGPVRSRSAAS
jgi:hypothetical protein